MRDVPQTTFEGRFEGHLKLCSTWKEERAITTSPSLAPHHHRPTQHRCNGSRRLSTTTTTIIHNISAPQSTPPLPLSFPTARVIGCFDNSILNDVIAVNLIHRHVAFFSNSTLDNNNSSSTTMANNLMQPPLS